VNRILTAMRRVWSLTEPTHVSPDRALHAGLLGYTLRLTRDDAAVEGWVVAVYDGHLELVTEPGSIVGFDYPIGVGGWSIAKIIKGRA
jgi:hypothetical protein